MYKRPDGRWAGIVDLGWQDGKRRLHFVYGKTKAEAVGKLQELQRQVLAGVPILTSGDPLGD